MQRMIVVSICWIWLFSHPLSASEDERWEPVPPEEMSLAEDPLRPGSAAIALYREQTTNYDKSFEDFHSRVKILSEEGKRFADVELPYLENWVEVRDLQGRIIRPDGTVLPFEGAIHRKTVARRKDLEIYSRVFTFPEVEVGSILEYRYRLEWKYGVPAIHEWLVQDDISLLRGRFVLINSVSLFHSLRFGWTMFFLPEGQRLEPRQDGSWVLEVANIPAFRSEEYMPPADALRARVRFFPEAADMPRGSAFWEEFGKRAYQSEEKFIGDSKDLRKEALAIAPPDLPPEQRLRRLYARVLEIDNLGYPTGQREGRGKPKENKSAKDVLKRGYGEPWEVNRLLVALARGAGFESFVALLCPRRSRIFVPDMLDRSQLNAHVVIVRFQDRDGEKEIFLDPATRLAPFGFLTWDQTGVEGLRLERSGGVRIRSPVPKSEDSVTECKAELSLDAKGTAEGTVEVLFRGEAALSLRTKAAQASEPREDLKEELQGWLPSQARIDFKEVGPWEDPERPLRAVFHLQVPGFAQTTSRRLIVPLAAFHLWRKHPFASAERTHPIYFPYPWRELDDITYLLPAGFEVEAMPEATTAPAEFGRYRTSCERIEGGLRFRRELTVDGIVFPQTYYPILRNFFERLREGDRAHALLRKTTME